jgi:anti-sigma B factor antagonist
MGDTSEFRVAVKPAADGPTVVAVFGDLDLSGAEQLEVPLMAALADSPVVLDLSGCDFCDSSGIRTLLRAASAGPSFRIAAAGPETVRVLELTGLLTVLNLYPDVETALKD